MLDRPEARARILIAPPVTLARIWKFRLCIVNEQVLAIVELLQKDQRYHLEAYQFVREGLAYAQKVMKLPAIKEEGSENPQDHHLTGQQLCQAIKEYARPIRIHGQDGPQQLGGLFHQ